LLVLLLALAACNAPGSGRQKIPESFPPMLVPADNPTTNAGIALGRMLFYDPILSADSTVSCSSCHKQQYAFADAARFSAGIDGQLGVRNAPSLANVGFYRKGLFWDGRAAGLEEQSLHPISSAGEMGSDWPSVISRLNQNSQYQKAFRRAFGDKPITPQRIARALAQFERQLVSYRSRYDQFVAGKVAFNEQELRGLSIFFDASPTLPNGECSHCHADPLFTNHAYHNGGVEAVTDLEDLKDPGRAAFTGKYYDRGRFRVPSLRNLGFTSPYMHNGQFADLFEVLQHYNNGGNPQVNVSPNIRSLHLSQRDKEDLLAFLKTLDDESLITEPKLSNPFEDHEE